MTDPELLRKLCVHYGYHEAASMLNIPKTTLHRHVMKETVPRRLNIWSLRAAYAAHRLPDWPELSSTAFDQLKENHHAMDQSGKP